MQVKMDCQNCGATTQLPAPLLMITVEFLTGESYAEWQCMLCGCEHRQPVMDRVVATLLDGGASLAAAELP